MTMSPEYSSDFAAFHWQWFDIFIPVKNPQVGRKISKHTEKNNIVIAWVFNTSIKMFHQERVQRLQIAKYVPLENISFIRRRRHWIFIDKKLQHLCLCFAIMGGGG